jgi:hypothetical protein
VVAADVQFFDRIGREARQRALVSLGLAQLQQEKEELERQKETIGQRDDQVDREMLATVRGVPLQAKNERGYFSIHSQEVERAVSRRRQVHEDELLAESPIGQQVLKLRQEEASVLDAVWLATSPVQIRQLWEKVAQLLNDENSRLVSDALTIAPE